MIYPPTRIADCRDAHSALAALCDGLPEAAGPAPPFEETDPARMPPLFRKLLAHQDHMTTALEDHYGRPVELRVLADQLSGDSYSRAILLTLRGTDRVVEFGIVRMDLRFSGTDVKGEILERRRPLGDILIRHDVLRRVEPRWYVHFATGCPWLDHFGPGAVAEAYGRLGIIYCDHQPAIELLEIVADVGGGEGRAR